MAPHGNEHPASGWAAWRGAVLQCASQPAACAAMRWAVSHEGDKNWVERGWGIAVQAALPGGKA